MKKSLLKSFIREVLKEQEAPKNAPYGQYLFAPQRPDMKIKEPNTKKEDEFFGALVQHYIEGEPQELGDIAPEVLTQKNKGNYKQILQPGFEQVFRMMVVRPTEAQKLLGLSAAEIVAKPNEGIVVSKPGILNPMSINNGIQSWSIHVEISWVKDLFGIKLPPRQVAVVFKASTTENNNFFMNPDFPFIVQNINQYVDEEEIISYGPVKYHTASFVYADEIIPMDKVLIELMKDIYEEA